MNTLKAQKRLFLLEQAFKAVGKHGSSSVMVWAFLALLVVCVTKDFIELNNLNVADVQKKETFSLFSSKFSFYLVSLKYIINLKWLINFQKVRLDTSALQLHFLTNQQSCPETFCWLFFSSLHFMYHYHGLQLHLCLQQVVRYNAA